MRIPERITFKEFVDSHEKTCVRNEECWLSGVAKTLTLPFPHTLVVVTFFSHARILGEISIIHSPPSLFLRVKISSEGTIEVINVLTFHNGTTHWALSVHTTFSDLGHISRLRRISFNWKFYVLIRLSWTLKGLLYTSSKLWICQLFWRSLIF